MPLTLHVTIVNTISNKLRNADVFTLISNMKQEQQKESQPVKINKLSGYHGNNEENSKMAAEIKALKSTVADLRCA